jgi:hypothetical protein
MLAGCRSKNITEYYASVMRPGSAELMIVMELLSCSVADLVGAAALGSPSAVLGSGNPRCCGHMCKRYLQVQCCRN